MKYINVLFLFYFITSCGSSYRLDYRLLNNDHSQSVLTFIDKQGMENDYKVLILLPSVGCAGCISSTEQFIKNLYTHSDDVYLVITNTASKKDAMARLDLVGKDKHVYFDYNNELYDHNNTKRIYPLIIYLNNDYYYEYVEPTKPNALNNLSNHLNI